MNRPRIIAYYLPQYHPIPENDEWWGKGFTEWTNVGKARPLFRGHYQPKVPGELGYYDLRLSEVREAQVLLAKEAGVDAFCYWHYWFGNGKQLLEMPFSEVVRSGKPDFPFCLGWANESWEAKEWNTEGSNKVRKVLIRQEYPGKEDNLRHFQSLVNAFRDPRYVRIDGKPLFLIYRPLKFEHLDSFIQQWNTLIKNEGIADSFYFVGQANDNQEIEKVLSFGFNAVTINMSSRMAPQPKIVRNLFWYYHKLKRKCFKKPIVIDYKDFLSRTWYDEIEGREDIIPTILPNWDHSPRSQTSAVVLNNSTPELFECQCENVFRKVRNKRNQLVFLKSWNEWGEGNYMEPDLKYGKGYINALAKAIHSSINS